MIQTRNKNTESICILEARMTAYALFNKDCAIRCVFYTTHEAFKLYLSPRAKHHKTNRLY